MAGPGRPRKNPVPDNSVGSEAGGITIEGNAVIIEPAEIGPDAGTEAEGPAAGTEAGPKKRGRKPGSKTGSKKEKVHVTASAIAQMLYGIHKLMAARIPEMELEKAEAEALGVAISNVEKLYEFETSEKAMAWAALTFTAGSIYGQRFAAIRIRKAADKAEAAREVNPEATIYPFGNAGMANAGRAQ